MEAVADNNPISASPFLARKQPDLFSRVIHLVLADLYKLRRQKRLLSIVIAFYLLLLTMASGLDTLGFLSEVHNAVYGDLGGHPTRLDYMVQALQPFRFPISFVLANMMVVFSAPIPLSILVASLIGTDYRSGMLLLLLARGIARTDYYIGKLSTILLLATIAVATALVLVQGYRWIVVQIVLPGVVNPDFLFSGTWLLTALWTIVQAILGVFLYGLIAYLLTLLTRSTAVGIAGCLALWIVESFVTLQIAASLNGAQNTTAQWIRFLPKNTSESLINGMITRLVPFGHGNWHDISFIFMDQTKVPISWKDPYYLVSVNQDSITGGFATGSYYGLSLWSQAMTVLLCYLLVLLLANWWLQVRRDVTS